MTSLPRDAGDRYPFIPPEDVRRARIHVVSWLAPGTSAMTLGRHILVRRGCEDDSALLGHELVHVRQWREHGVLAFLASYVVAYLRGRTRGRGHWEAYEAIPFEVEARALSGR